MAVPDVNEMHESSLHHLNRPAEHAVILKHLKELILLRVFIAISSINY